MRKLASLCLALLALVCLAANVQEQEIRNDYFSLNLPADWNSTVSKPQSNGSVTVLLQSKTDKLVITITVVPAPLPAQMLAEQTVQSMRTGGITVKEPVQQGDSYVVEFSHDTKQVKGLNYFTSNGSKGSVVTIMAPDTDGFAKGKAFLQETLKPVDARLFPASY